MRKQDVQVALREINHVLDFKLALECLELRFYFYLALRITKLHCRPSIGCLIDGLPLPNYVLLFVSMLSIGQLLIAGCNFTIGGLR
ncbi:hypothetical protein MRB53_023429 [Persea americana]|uniref:Uncharacterized protein n=1 Tax=Persea americana TaxID=3435 RepID=A0ACC2L9K7_PERAE|nr:hypothetical protein MRB53_023429 [Persea americana]